MEITENQKKFSSDFGPKWAMHMERLVVVVILKILKTRNRRLKKNVMNNSDHKISLITKAVNV